MWPCVLVHYTFFGKSNFRRSGWSATFPGFDLLSHVLHLPAEDSVDDGLHPWDSLYGLEENSSGPVHPIVVPGVEYHRQKQHKHHVLQQVTQETQHCPAAVPWTQIWIRHWFAELINPEQVVSRWLWHNRFVLVRVREYCAGMSPYHNAVVWPGFKER